MKRPNRWLLAVLVSSLLGGSAVYPLARLHAAPSSANEMQATKVSLNKATASELESIRGVGPLLAERIVQYRETKGPFKSLEDLIGVPGIGQKKFAKLKDQIAL